jgi:hypothetical protein
MKRYYVEVLCIWAIYIYIYICMYVYIFKKYCYHSGFLE